MPLKVFVLAMFHHCMTFTMLIPTNIMMGEELIYPKALFFLSFGAGTALLLRQYCTMLDINTD